MSQSDIAAQLLQIKAIKLNLKEPYIWASGITSPIYCDNRVALSNVEVRKNILQSFLIHANKFLPCTLIAGVATAGIPWGAMIADAMELPFAYVRSKAKQHGRKNLIEGKINSSDQVLVIEDLISTGGSSLKAVEAIRETGATVLHVLAIFEYEFKQARDQFAEAHCNYSTLSNYSRLLESARSNEYITSSEIEILANWKSDPQSWGTKYNKSL